MTPDEINKAYERYQAKLRGEVYHDDDEHSRDEKPDESAKPRIAASFNGDCVPIAQVAGLTVIPIDDESNLIEITPEILLRTAAYTPTGMSVVHTMESSDSPIGFSQSEQELEGDQFVADSRFYESIITRLHQLSEVIGPCRPIKVTSVNGNVIMDTYAILDSCEVSEDLTINTLILMLPNRVCKQAMIKFINDNNSLAVKAIETMSAHLQRSSTLSPSDLDAVVTVCMSILLTGLDYNHASVQEDEHDLLCGLCIPLDQAYQPMEVEYVGNAASLVSAVKQGMVHNNEGNSDDDDDDEDEDGETSTFIIPFCSNLQLVEDNLTRFNMNLNLAQ